MKNIKIIKEKCVGCELCVSQCPFGAISIVEKKADILETCTLCGACVESCKFLAIEFQRDFVENDDAVYYEGIWVYAEHKDHHIVNVTLELLGEGRQLSKQLGTEVSAILVGNNVDHIAQELILYGADNVYVVDDPSLSDFNDESYATITTNLINKYKPEIVLVGATTYGKSLAPRISSRLHTGLTADCTRLEIDKEKRLLLQTRPAFGGNLMATIICPNHKPQMATVRPRVMKAMEPDHTRVGKIIHPAVDIPLVVLTKVLHTINNLTEMVNLTEAEIIVSAGRGMSDPKNLKLVKELADVLGAAVGASRAVVDAGWMEYSHQVGQTGKTVGPKIYFACGISGAVQHLAGMSSSDTIIAINKNPDAPIFKVATFGIVGDVLEILPILTQEFKKRLS